MKIEQKRVCCLYTGLPHEPGGCEIYRVQLPFMYLTHRYNWLTQWLYLGDIQEDYNARGNAAVIELVQSFDLFVFPRMVIYKDEHHAEMMKTFFTIIHDMGKYIVYEIDDDYTNQYRDVTDGDIFTPSKWADAVTVTTPFLAQTMRQVSKRPVYVLPNCITGLAFWERQKIQRIPEMQDKVLIALTGSPTHYEDWKPVAPALRRVLNEIPNAYLLVMGFIPDYLEGLPNTTYFPPKNYDTYTQIINNCDIVLCPVDPDDGFNMSKSEIKAVEGMAAGAAVIATNNPVYRLAVKTGKNGLTVEQTPEAWYNGLSSLLLNPSYRMELAASGQNWAKRNRDIAERCEDWAKAYSKILSKPQNAMRI